MIIKKRARRRACKDGRPRLRKKPCALPDIRQGARHAIVKTSKKRAAPKGAAPHDALCCSPVI